LFPAAGRTDLPWFWAYIGVNTAYAAAGFLFLDPELIKERFRPAEAGHDRWLVQIETLLALTHYVVAGLDAGRFHWSETVPAWTRGIAFAVLASCFAATFWSMKVNPFFSSVIRLQEDRGHRVICDGPYTIVRHPGYLFILLILATSGPVLGSWWSCVPTGVVAVLIIRRTILEDRFLLAQLAGYPVYARQVRYRLVPRLW